MNKSKVIAGVIFLVVFFGPFRALFFTDEIVNGAKFVAEFMAVIIGFFVAFGIGTQDSFNKSEEMISEQQKVEEKQRKAA
ncbi:hypothetical protein BH09BAC5_BH09BAC5_07680 [soil metagenome]